MKINISLLWIAAFCLLISGCSNYRELNELGVIIAMGVDQNDDPKQPYRVTYQVINPSGLSQTNTTGGQGLAVINYTITGKTLLEALGKSASVIPRENNTTHLSLIIIGEKLARNDLDLIFDGLDRGKYSRVSIPIFIARGKTAKDVLGVIEPLEVTPGKNIISTTQNNQKLYGSSSEVLAYEIIASLLSEGKDVSVPGISISNASQKGKQTGNLETTNPTTIKVKGLAIFRKGKLMRWLDGETARAAQFVTSKVKNTPVVLPCEKGNVTINTIGVKSKMLTEIHHEKPVIHTDINVMGELLETSCVLNLSDPRVLKKFEKKMENELKKQIKRTVSITQKEKSDIFGFGDALSRTNPVFWRQNKKKWNNLYSDAQISLKIHVEIINSGLLMEPYEPK
ncbi:Ger(x)C family spore germination protein [Peribacillus frigoritolerans]|uniref:Ger(x)C family spore germination protein n=1 Tax=Peribacillus frigoritolerans TaxID=450367 RepID=UPI0024C100EE|nr:Ger(x)C family spore germination protein [Peribacillus frigoritolerans]MDM5314189.1 Ger(x)C family spore germination protein [Peribacillus frigoritolerans]WHX64353.1 Ger(x)C family spore germination protein [Peribacillus frigoritolerans]